MKKLSLLFTLFLSIMINAQSLTKVQLKPNGTVSASGKLENGSKMNDLSWAWRSSVACFPATQQDGFNGSHVLFETAIPPHSILNIELIPKNGKEMSLYAYEIGMTSKAIVPNLTSCVSCEADNNQMKKATNNHRTVRLNAINNPYKVIVGVAGAKGLTSGDFELKFHLEGGEVKTATQETVQVLKCQDQALGTKMVYEGDLSKGVIIQDLSWAWNSSVACFPATQQQSFQGNHVVYQTSIPKYSKMIVTIEPENGQELSLYGYQVGTSSNYVVPNLPSCVSCEADNNQMGKATSNKRSIEFIAINHPYKVYIGVAGAKGVTSGKFKLTIEVIPR